MFCNGCGKELSIPHEPCPYCGVLNTLGSQQHKATGIVSHVGLVIDGKYKIDSKLGSGGMATVYRATRLLIGDTVAIKILHPDQVRDPQSAERFRREAQAAARLKHPNAVTIHDFGVSNDGLIYLVMELVEGKSIRTMIREQGPLTPTTTAEILRQACAALEEAHKHHIVHRDVKPDNIVVAVTPAGLRVKVLDFGIARMRDIVAANITQTGSVMGTPHYMSPEQCLGEELDRRSDIYSLGVVLFEMLAGVVPFNSPTSSAVIIQHVNQAPPPLRVINISVPPAVETVVLHALSKRREDRPQSAQLLAEEFSDAIGGGTVAHANAETLRSKRDAEAATPPVGLAATQRMSTPAWRNDPANAPSNASPSLEAKPTTAESITRPTRRHSGAILGMAALAAVALVAAAGYLWTKLPSEDYKPDNSGLYPVHVNGKYGFMNNSGATVIRPEFDEAHGFSEGLSAVRIGEKYGYIDTKGTVVITPQFDQAYVFRYGRAPVKLCCGASWDVTDAKHGKKGENKYGFIDKTGRFIGTPSFLWVSLAGSRDFELVRTSDGKAAIMDASGKVLIADRVEDFLDDGGAASGLAPAATAGKWGYINSNGEWAIDPQFEQAFGYSEGLAAVRVGGRIGYIDMKGKFAINPQYLFGDLFSEGRASVKLDFDKVGFIDTTGRFIVEAKFLAAGPFTEGLASVKTKEGWGFIDPAGQLVINPQFDSAEPFQNGLARVVVAGKEAYINRAATFVVDPFSGTTVAAVKARIAAESALTAPRIDTIQPSVEEDRHSAPPAIVDGNTTSAFYIISVDDARTEAEARAKVAKVKNNGYPAGYLWIPDYASLSGAKAFAIYVGPYATQYECEVATEEYRKTHPAAYGILVSQERKRVQIDGIDKVKVTQH